MWEILSYGVGVAIVRQFTTREPEQIGIFTLFNATLLAPVALLQVVFLALGPISFLEELLVFMLSFYMNTVHMLYLLYLAFLALYRPFVDYQYNEVFALEFVQIALIFRQYMRVLPDAIQFVKQASQE